LKRPVSLTFVAWSLILGGTLALVAPATSYRVQFSELGVDLSQLQNGWSDFRFPILVRRAALLALMIPFPLTNIASGLGILNRLAWSRTFYVAMSVFGFAIAYDHLLFLSGWKKVPLVLTVIPFMLAFAPFVNRLYQPATAEYFGQKQPVRPISLTIVSWFLILSSAFSISGPIAEGYNYSNQQDASTAVFLLLLTGVPVLINFIVAAAILRKREWSRKIYAVLAVLGGAGSLFVTYSADHSMETMDSVLSGVLLSVLFVALLYRRAATQYFRSNQDLDIAKVF